MSEAKSLGEVVLYQAADGGPALKVWLEHETDWLSLKQIAELFDRDKSVISRHLRNVFASGELEREATVARSATVQRESRPLCCTRGGAAGRDRRGRLLGLRNVVD